MKRASLWVCEARIPNLSFSIKFHQSVASLWAILLNVSAGGSGAVNFAKSLKGLYTYMEFLCVENF